MTTVMTTTLLALFVAVGGFLAFALWYIRRTNPAAALPATPRATRSLPGCDVGQQLLMASATQTTAGSVTESAPDIAAPKRKPARRGPTRRSFLRNGLALGWLGVLSGFGAAVLAQMWPDLRGGFGARLEAGTEDEILDYIRTNREPFEFPAGRTYFVEYDPRLDPDDQYAELTNGARVMALYWRCVHLGCKVPWCMSSQWLECPCHGSRYNRWGEWQGGPAPRGLDRFPVEVVDGVVFVDTGQLNTGPSRQEPALEQPAEGPTCV